MNKYQEALDKLKRDLSFYDPILGIYRELRLDEQFLLQELVDRETPYKPIRKTIITDDYGGLKIFEEKDVCECGYYVYESEIYCAKCGRKLDWNKDE